MRNIYLGLGSNIGNRFENIKSAILKLVSFSNLELCSSVWETSPWGFVSQPTFLNCVVRIESLLSSLDLLKEILRIEIELGRKKTQKFGPRSIDIDILFCNGKIINTTKLIIPHPRLHKRKFALLPLNEIAPDFVHPILKKTVNEMLCLIEQFSIEEKCELFMSSEKFLLEIKL